MSDTTTADPCEGLPCLERRGTYAGYIRVLKINKGVPKEDKHPTCAECKEAARAYTKERHQKRKERKEEAPPEPEPEPEGEPFAGNQTPKGRSWSAGQFPAFSSDAWVHTLDGLNEQDMTCHVYLDGMQDGRLQVSDLPASKREGFINKVGDDFLAWLGEQDFNFDGAAITLECKHSKFATHVSAVEVVEWNGDSTFVSSTKV